MQATCENIREYLKGRIPAVGRYAVSGTKNGNRIRLKICDPGTGEQLAYCAFPSETDISEKELENRLRIMEQSAAGLLLERKEDTAVKKRKKILNYIRKNKIRPAVGRFEVFSSREKQIMKICLLGNKGKEYYCVSIPDSAELTDRYLKDVFREFKLVIKDIRRAPGGKKKMYCSEKKDVSFNKTGEGETGPEYPDHMESSSGGEFCNPVMSELDRIRYDAANGERVSYDTPCEEVNAVLSAVRDIEMFSIGRSCSFLLLTDFLSGTRSEEIRKKQLDRSRLFGKLKKQNVKELVDAMEECGMITVSGDGTVSVCQQCGSDQHWCTEDKFYEINEKENPNIIEKHQYCRYAEENTISDMEIILKALEFAQTTRLTGMLSDEFKEKLNDDVKMYLVMLDECV